ncbi:hypothetical protein K402DRAFT_408209 [Aulographum hederae CBS 113979]|uniref:Uncharacterized protein n=1 Tax=Aulographum hederae CBS 113979 TaxID=1176131 RepID=A0A6G1GLC0_9PEZI|nr:hypothetical protein K402DRAFT_408209 [Aulographum hederae CBS 113979]
MTAHMSGHFQHWTMKQKNNMSTTGVRSESRASSPSTLSESETRLHIPAGMPIELAANQTKTREHVYSEKRYLSSEEALSPAEPDLEDDVESYGDASDVFEGDDASDFDDGFQLADGVSIDTLRIIKAFDYAIRVAIVAPGRPKLVDMPSPAASVYNVSSIRKEPVSVPLRGSSLSFEKEKSTRPTSRRSRQTFRKRNPEARLSATSFADITTPLASPGLPKESSPKTRSSMPAAPLFQRSHSDLPRALATHNLERKTIRPMSASPDVFASSAVDMSGFLTKDPFGADISLISPLSVRSPSAVTEPMGCVSPMASTIEEPEPETSGKAPTSAPDIPMKSHSRLKSISRSISIARLVTPSRRPPPVPTIPANSSTSTATTKGSSSETQRSRRDSFTPSSTTTTTSSASGFGTSASSTYANTSGGETSATTQSPSSAASGRATAFSNMGSSLHRSNTGSSRHKALSGPTLLQFPVTQIPPLPAQARQSQQAQAQQAHKNLSLRRSNAISAPQPPAMSSQKAKIKMVPRGANERAPPSFIPSFPGTPIGSDGEDDDVDSSEDEFFRLVTGQKPRARGVGAMRERRV